MNLINAGSQLANIAYSLALRTSRPLSLADAALLGAACKQWDEARRTPAAPSVLTDEQINHIGEQWDGCTYDGPSGLIDIGEALRLELKELQPAASAPAPAAPLTPNWAGEFKNYAQWVNKAQRWLKSPTYRQAICVDAKGRRCAIGADMMRARDEDAFPVRYFWDCEPTISAAPADPLDTPLPYDITVGACTLRAGVPLRTLVARVQVLHDMAMESPLAQRAAAGSLVTTAAGAPCDICDDTRTAFGKRCVCMGGVEP